MPIVPAFNYCSAAATRLFIKELFYLDTVDPAPYPLLNVVLFSSEISVNEYRLRGSLPLRLGCHSTERWCLRAPHRPIIGVVSANN